MAAQAVTELNRSSGNVELAALLAIRSLKSTYYPVADSALIQASRELYNQRTFSGHTDWVLSVAFSPDGKHILTGSFDHTARLWDVDSGQLVRTFSGHTDWVLSVAFSPD